MKIVPSSFVVVLLLAANIACAGELDNYYLNQFGELSSAPFATVFKAATAVPPSKCGMPLRHGLKKDWDKLETSTQKTLAKYLAKPILSGTVDQQKSYDSSGGHFTIHYTTASPDAPPPADNNFNTIPDWVETVAGTFEAVYAKEVTDFGYTAPPTAPGTRYDVYLQQRVNNGSGDFGYTESDILTGQSATSFIVIDNDFADLLYHPYTGLSGLQITAAHEFHHAIQYGYNYYFQVWYAEATSTWMEDEVYDSINQLYDYSVDYLQNPSLSLDTPASITTGGGYGRWIFNRSLAETFGIAKIRSVWETLRNTTSSGIDIPMLPVLDAHFKNTGSDLATEFMAFAKKLYTKQWTSHTSDLNLLYSTPLTIQAAYSQYPVNQTTSTATTVTLPHYAIAYYKFTPSAAVPDLTITISKNSSIQASVLKKTSGIFSDIPVNTSGNSFTINGFSSLSPSTDEVVLLLVNTSAADNQQANVSTDGSSPPIATPSGGGGGGGGCFIATAAYGSYLHPKVMVLREFRDHYLLSNAPGRAFVAIYYRISPPIAELIRQHEAVRFVVRLLLGPLIFATGHLWTTLVIGMAALTSVACLAIRKRKKNNVSGQIGLKNWKLQ
jgi:hypothetical protein